MVNLESIAITEADRWLLGADDCQFNDGSVRYQTGFSDCHRFVLLTVVPAPA
jgi:hypothetical protein